MLGAVSSFGLGGGNAHAVLESAPASPLPNPGGHGVLTISAPSAQALRPNVESMAAALRTVAADRVGAWCRSTNIVKRSHRHRVALEGDRDALVDGLQQFLAGARAHLASAGPPRRTPGQRRTAFFRPGYAVRGHDAPTLRSQPRYTARTWMPSLPPCDPHAGLDLLAAIFGDDTGLDHTSLAQPALFAVSYALGKTLLQSGIQVSFGIGHSVGEISAACLAGVLTVDDAARLVVTRGRLMGSLPPGGAMIAIDLDAAQAEALVADAPGCVIAAVNGPRSLTISGTTDAVARVKRSSSKTGGKAISLAVSHAFHSPLMEPIVTDFRDELDGLEPQPARFPLFSTVLGRQVDGREMTADYWATQLCSPVRFHRRRSGRREFG